MKRCIYLLLVVTLAIGLTGCNESGGGYYPADRPAVGDAKEGPISLGGSLSPAKVIGISEDGVSSDGTIGYANSALSACAAISDFLPAGLPLSFGGAALSSLPSFSIRAASRTKSRGSSGNIEYELSLTEADNGYSLFTQTAEYGDSYTTKYTLYVRFRDASGKVLTVKSTDSNFWAGSENADSIEFYGEWQTKVKTTSSDSSSHHHHYDPSDSVRTTVHDSDDEEDYYYPYHTEDYYYPYHTEDGSTSSKGQTSVSEFVIEGKFGSPANPCFIGGFKGTTLYAHISSSLSQSGIINGQNFSSNFTSVVSGPNVYLNKGGLFSWTTSPGSPNYYGTGTYTTTSQDGTVVKMVAEGTKYSWYVNGKLVYTYPSSN